MDLRALLEQFDAASDLKRYQVGIDLNQELAALCRREFRRKNGSALLFEKLINCDSRSAANLFGSKQRMLRILRSVSFTQFAEKISTSIETAKGSAAQRLQKIAKNVTGYPPNQIPQWSRQSKATLLDLPAIKSWPLETRPYCTLPLVVTQHPLTGEQNLALYRVQIINEQQAAINIPVASGAGEHLSAAAKLGVKLPVALVFGSDLALYWLAAAPLPSNCNEYGLFQNLFSDELFLSKCCTQDLLVPADAEFVVEGQISAATTCHEGPFGNHTGQYVTRDDCPLMQVTSIAWREQAIMPFTVVGPPPSENIYLAKASEVLIRTMLKIDYPAIVDLKMPDLTIFHGVALLQVARPALESIPDLIFALWQNSPLQKAKLIMLFDEDINLSDYGQAYWRLINQIESRRIYQRGNQIAIDATGVDPKLLVVEDKETSTLLKCRDSEYDL